jgi:hypothetical protein
MIAPDNIMLSQRQISHCFAAEGGGQVGGCGGGRDPLRESAGLLEVVDLLGVGVPLCNPACRELRSRC